MPDDMPTPSPGPVSDRVEGRSPSTPPARQARSHRPMVPREYRRVVPSGCPSGHAAIARTTAPRSQLASQVFAASAITAHRCSAISCRIFSSITPGHSHPGTGDTLRVTGSQEA